MGDEGRRGQEKEQRAERGEIERARGERREERGKRSEERRVDREQFKKDLFEGLLSIIPRQKAEVALCADPPKETGHLSDSQIWNGYEWERD